MTNPKIFIVTASLFGVALLSGVAFNIFTNSVSADPQPAIAPATLSVSNVFPIPPQPTGSVSAASSVDFLLEIDGIDAGNPPIEVMSWSFGASNPTSVGSSGMSAGKASFSDLSIMKSVDKSSPLLFKALASGKHFASATLTKRTTVESPDGTVKPTILATYKLSDVMVSSVVEGGWSGGGDTEMLSLSYAKIEMKVDGQPVIFTYDLKANKK